METSTTTPGNDPRHRTGTLTPDELDRLRAVPKHPRDQALIEVMAGCGLRVRELCRLRVDQVRWHGEAASLALEDRRGRPRTVPLTAPAQDALRVWLSQRAPLFTPYVFCGLRTGQPLSRKTVWAALQRHARRGGLRPIAPFVLRRGTAHHTPTGHPRLSRPPHPDRHQPATVGRSSELRRLQALVDQRVSVLLIGPRGVGKSHLLAQLHGDRLVRVRSLAPFRPALLTIARALHQAGVLGADAASADAVGAPPGPAAAPDAPASSCVQPMTAQPATGETPVLAEAGPPSKGENAGVPAPPARAAAGFDTFLRQHGRTPVADWIELILRSVRRDEWVLLIDDLSGLTPASGRLLAELRQGFSYAAAVERVPASCRPCLEPCERLHLSNLSRRHARQLVRQQVARLELEVEDHVLLETRLVCHSGGNPGAILACLERLRKEPRVTLDAIRRLDPGLNAPMIDLTPAIVVPVVLLIGIRFVARGIGDAELYVLSGLGSALVMAAQFFLFRVGRRTV